MEQLERLRDAVGQLLDGPTDRNQGNAMDDVIQAYDACVEAELTS